MIKVYLRVAKTFDNGDNKKSSSNLQVTCFFLSDLWILQKTRLQKLNFLHKNKTTKLTDRYKSCSTWHRATMSASPASMSTTLPFPSSPHWAPKTTVALFFTWFASRSRGRLANLVSGSFSVCPLAPLLTISSASPILISPRVARRWEQLLSRLDGLTA